MREDDDDIQDYVRPWVGLSDEDVNDLCKTFMGQIDKMAFIKATEAKLKEKNT